jgi:hypothetical protein
LIVKNKFGNVLEWLEGDDEDENLKSFLDYHSKHGYLDEPPEVLLEKILGHQNLSWINLEDQGCQVLSDFDLDLGAKQFVIRPLPGAQISEKAQSAFEKAGFSKTDSEFKAPWSLRSVATLSSLTTKERLLVPSHTVAAATVDALGQKQEKQPLKEAWENSDLASAPNIPDSAVKARKLSEGKHVLEFTGTGNEVFPGELFISASEARTFFQVQKIKAQQARRSSSVEEPKVDSKQQEDKIHPLGLRHCKIQAAENLKGKIASLELQIKDWTNREYKNHGGSVQVGTNEEQGDTPWEPGIKNKNVDSINAKRRANTIKKLQEDIKFSQELSYKIELLDENRPLLRQGAINLFYALTGEDPFLSERANEFAEGLIKQHAEDILKNRKIAQGMTPHEILFGKEEEGPAPWEMTKKIFSKDIVSGRVVKPGALRNQYLFTEDSPENIENILQGKSGHPRNLVYFQQGGLHHAHPESSIIVLDKKKMDESKLLTERDGVGEYLINAKDIKDAIFNTYKNQYELRDKGHKDFVEFALTEKNHISAEVLADYPGLLLPKTEQPPYVPSVDHPINQIGRRIGTNRVTKNGTPIQIVVGNDDQFNRLYDIETIEYDEDFEKIRNIKEYNLALDYVLKTFKTLDGVIVSLDNKIEGLKQSFQHEIIPNSLSNLESQITSLEKQRQKLASIKSDSSEDLADIQEIDPSLAKQSELSNDETPVSDLPKADTKKTKESKIRNPLKEIRQAEAKSVSRQLLCPVRVNYLVRSR